MTGEHRHWGRAGQRLTQAEVWARRGEAARQQREREQREAAAYERWKTGMLIPWRITAALDLRGLYGPEVDLACRAKHPEVDQWEAGTRYPRWDQVQALAELTGFEPGWFFTDRSAEEPITLRQTSMAFHVKAKDMPPERDPVLECDPDAIAATVDPEQPSLF